MADNLCGPSDAMKGFLAHTERDRSLHQDRVAGNGAAEGFRSHQPALAFGDADFSAFQAGTNLAYGPGGVQGPALPHVPHPVPGLAAYGANAVSSVGAAQRAVPGPWANEFGVTLGRTPAPESAVVQYAGGLVTRQQAPAQNQLFNGFQNAPSAGFAGPFVPAQVMSPFAMGSYSTIPQQGMDVSQQQGIPAGGPFHGGVQQSMAGASSTMDWDGAFQEFEEAGQDAEHDAEFAREMDAWMDQHLERTEMLDEMKTEIMKEIADDEDQRRAQYDPILMPASKARQEQMRQAREQDELRRAASDILQTAVQDNSEKFKNSSFVALMKGITEGKIVLQDKELVDAVTGRPVVTEADGGAPEASVNAEMDVDAAADDAQAAQDDGASFFVATS